MLLKALEAEAATCPIGAGGVVVLPYWLGCMTPLLGSLCARRHRRIVRLDPARRRSIAPCWKE